VEKLDYSKINTISPKILSKLLDRNPNILLLDIRDNDAYSKMRMAKGEVLHLRMVDIIEDYGKLPSDREIIVFCHKGKQGPKAIAYLQNKKDLNILGILEGGIITWEKVGLPVEKS